MESYLMNVLLVLAASTVVLNSIQCSETPERECSGTARRLSLSGSTSFHYNAIRRRYAGCTIVRGNLELTWLTDKDHDLSFLSTIRVVTGYVLIVAVYADTIPLVSLEEIKGESLFRSLGADHGLFVALTSSTDSNRGLRQLLLPSLTEISRGDVQFKLNRNLCYVNTIDWDQIVRRDTQIVSSGVTNNNCGQCDDNCAREGVGRCWGSGVTECQKE